MRFAEGTRARRGFRFREPAVQRVCGTPGLQSGLAHVSGALLWPCQQPTPLRSVGHCAFECTALTQQFQGRVTLTRRNRLVWLAIAKLSPTVTVSLGEPVREISTACALSTMF